MTKRFPVTGLRRAALLIAAGLLLIPAGPVAAQTGPPPEVRAAVSRVLELLESEGEAPLRRFADEAMAARYRASFGDAALMDHLAAIRDAGRGRTGGVGVRPRPGGGLEVALDGGLRLLLELDDDAKVARLEVLAESEAEAGAAGRAGPEAPRLTWDGLPDQLRDAEAAGFAGVVLARRGGEVVVREAYGLADRETGRRTTTQLAYGIGSAAIDFTVALTRVLAARGTLSLDDPIGAYLADVPADRVGMTLRHILEGRSGLPDFHHTAADWDPDLAWIDRATAVRRILGQPLRFEPGTAEAHSHSAFVLLAAILETATGTPFPALVRSEILEPLGMSRTGFYGETLGLDLDDFAVGHGVSSVGLPNIPPNWGPTSWLIMGSGGMFSTLDDMDRLYRAIADGALEGHEPDPGRTALSGGSDRGYFILLARSGDGDSVLLLSNVEGPDTPTDAVGRGIVRLVINGGERSDGA